MSFVLPGAGALRRSQLAGDAFRCTLAPTGAVLWPVNHCNNQLGHSHNL